MQIIVKMPNKLTYTLSNGKITKEPEDKRDTTVNAFIYFLWCWSASI